MSRFNDRRECGTVDDCTDSMVFSHIFISRLGGGSGLPGAGEGSGGKPRFPERTGVPHLRVRRGGTVFADGYGVHPEPADAEPLENLYMRGIAGDAD